MQFHDQPEVVYKKCDASDDSQSRDVWSHEETSSLSSDAQQAKNTKLRKAILEHTDVDLISALCECAHNMLRGTVRLTSHGRRNA